AMSSKYSSSFLMVSPPVDFSDRSLEGRETGKSPVSDLVSDGFAPRDRPLVDVDQRQPNDRTVEQNIVGNYRAAIEANAAREAAREFHADDPIGGRRRRLGI